MACPSHFQAAPVAQRPKNGQLDAQNCRGVLATDLRAPFATASLLGGRSILVFGREWSLSSANLSPP
jgi:hypothetical protein